MMTPLPVIPGSATDLTITGPGGLNAVKGKADGPQNAEHSQALKDACTEFESLFIYQLIKEMRASIPDDGYLGKSMQSETYTSLFDIEIARRLSTQRGIGLADFLMQQLADRLSENSGEDTAT
jgi:flagellar protein FlgJ